MLPFERVQHAVLAISFLTLVWTGFALKYPDQWWARPLLLMEGTYSMRSLIHRIAAGVFMAVTLTHLVSLIVSRKLREHWKEMLPTTNDPREALSNFAYNLGLGSEPPGRSSHSYVEKAEYWAVVWGAVVMVATGLLLWANNLALRLLPKSWLDVATSVHFYEAVLATLAIVVWHFYSVIFDPDVYPLNTAFLTGITVRKQERSREREATSAGDDSSHDAQPIRSQGQELAVPDRSSVQQLGEPGRRGDRHHRHRLLAVSAARHAAGRQPEPLHRHPGVPGAAGAVLRRPDPDSAGNLAQAQARGATRHLSARVSAAHWRNADLRRLVYFVFFTTMVNLAIASQLSYSAVNYMDSVTFCGETCHTVMQPEYTAYQNSPHSRVECVKCHIGPGASWFVRSKLSGVGQVFAVTFHTYPTSHPHAGSQPASRAGDLRSLPLAAEVR